MGEEQVRSKRLLLGAALAYALLSSVGYFLGMYPRHRTETAWVIAGGLFVLLNIPTLFGRLIPSPPLVTARRPALVCGAFIAGGLAIYAFSLNVGQFSDDFVLLSHAQRWNILPSGWEHVRPLPVAIWATLTTLDVDAAGLHALNIVLHGLNGFLLFRLASALGFTVEASSWAGLLFLVFPGAVETVTWISGLQDVLMTTFVLVFLIAALADRWLYAILALAAALLSKETAVAAPLMLLLATLIRRVNLRLAAAAFALAAMFAVFRLAVSPDREFFEIPSGYFLKEFGARLFGGLVVGWTAAQLSTVPAIGVASVVSLGTLLGALLTRNINVRPAFVFLGWAVVAAAPVYAYFYVTADLQGSRYLYLPAAGWSLFVSWLAAVGSHRHLARCALAALVLIGAAGTITQQQRWQNASLLRDQVLWNARATALSLGCSNPSFENVPDSLDGVYVFRNGLPEALELGYADAGRTCVLRWDDGAFSPR
ncbi:MAG: hypothetical protein WD690_17940 [Vicinamibacterales bacterium]